MCFGLDKLRRLILSFAHYHRDQLPVGDVPSGDSPTLHVRLERGRIPHLTLLGDGTFEVNFGPVLENAIEADTCRLLYVGGGLRVVTQKGHARLNRRPKLRLLPKHGSQVRRGGLVVAQMRRVGQTG